MQTIGARIKKILKENRQTQKELSRATGIPESTFSDIIKGKKDPGLSKISLIADFLKVDLHWLITGQTFRESAYWASKVAEAVARGEYGVGKESFSDDEVEMGEQQKKYMNDIIAILKTLDEEERRLILEMAERLQQKRT
jgi:transcriptional regulator with XRE-family HTH domain